MKKLIKHITVIIVLLFLFVVGIWYPETSYILSDDFDRRSHFSTSNPTNIINDATDEFIKPFCVSYFDRGHDGFISPLITFLIDKKYKNFHLYYIEFNIKDKNFKYNIDEDFIISYNRDDSVFSNELWHYGGYYYLSSINMKSLFKNVKRDEHIFINTKLLYRFDDEPIKEQEFNYEGYIYRRMKNISPLGTIFLLLGFGVQ